MKIAIFGCGNLGRTLGASWALAGHTILWCSSRPEKAEYLASHFPDSSRACSYDEGAREAEIVLYTARSLRLVSNPLLLRQALIDCRNLPLSFDFEPSPGPSLAEQLAAEFPMATVVKALHLHAQELFEMPPEELSALQVSSFLCSDRMEALERVSALVLELGLVPVPCGPLKRARLLETMGVFWQSQIFEQQRGMTASLQLQVLPELATERFGGRLPGFPEE